MSQQRRSDAAPAIIVGLGEVLWDVFPDGARFGGAPANFACSAAGLAADSANVCMVSAVGTDELGRRAVQEIADHGVDPTYVARLDRQTGRVDVQVDDAGHASYEFAADTAWDQLDWSAELHDLAARTDVVCFGTLGQRSEQSRKAIRSFVAATPETCLRIFDVNLRPPFWDDDVIRRSLLFSNALKCNEDELPVLARIFDLAGSDRDMLTQLAQRFRLRLVALTRGGDGSLLVTESGEVSDLPGIETQVVDTVGAGDSFTAALALGFLNRLPLATTHVWASKVAAFVCSQAGATPVIPPELHMPTETV